MASNDPRDYLPRGQSTQGGRQREVDEEMAGELGKSVDDFLAYDLLPPTRNGPNTPTAVPNGPALFPSHERNTMEAAGRAGPPERQERQESRRPGRLTTSNESRGSAKPPAPSIHATAQRLTEAEVQMLITRIKHWKDDKNDSGATVSYQISLAEVQRLYLRRLQCRLADHVAKLVKGTVPAEDDEWAEDLHRYVQALQDHDYMNTCAVQRPRDPFLITGDRLVDREVLVETVERHLSPQECRRLDPPTANLRLHWEQKRLPIAEPRSHSRSVAFLQRLTAAAVAAAFLIGPMWLMMLDRALYPSLIATTVFIVVFGLLMVLVLQDPTNVVSSAAAYAAVLVVFVGLTVT
ncbi:hypothetical protein SPI_05406 [Niveomyces insectorum RCEF 264]|uniref:DUF6594 domain-containing protein n=1 Tax=Niveomyces insectorum RCEF 264 TaxID=1081102 RepID=A0A167T6U5_9HYPO|nr:hypothetical protein SPI_05406 [Niveomyces insectorum RCEF 264]